MRASGFRRLLVALCLLILQGQVLAAGSLACAHVDFSGEDRAAGCPYHGSIQDTVVDVPAGAPFDCAKCALDLALGSGSLPVAVDVLPVIHRPGPVRPSLGITWPSLPPDRFYRPPIG
jgi:hypothetical protein